MQQKELLNNFRNHDYKALARCITIVENELPGYEDILLSLNFENNTLISIDA